MDRRQGLVGDAGGVGDVVAEPVRAASARSIATIRAMRSGWAPVSCAWEESWTQQEPGTLGVRYPAMSDAQRDEVLAVDIVVVGAGAAGLYAALTAAEHGARVAVVSATPLAQTASYWAQGGLAAALAVDDSPELHLADTDRAGRGLMRARRRGPRHEAPRLSASSSGCGCASTSTAPATSRSGSRAVIRAAASCTRAAARPGAASSRQLSAELVRHEACRCSRRRASAGSGQTDGRVVGVVCDDGRAVSARGTILATGGAAALWAGRPTRRARWASGCCSRRRRRGLADLELVQFHPTAVTGDPGREGFLVTEAIRGEGATLHGPDGERFVDELAPRDEVARAIWDVMQRERVAARVAGHARGRSGAISRTSSRRCARRGSIPRSEQVPVAPAAHYVMGGVACDLARASARRRPLRRSARPRAPGCTAPTGWPPTRSSECVVFGERAALAALDEPRAAAGRRRRRSRWRCPSRETREALWRDAGLTRDRAGLERLLDDPHPLARIVARCALLREETRGAHVRTDFPETDPGLDRMHAVTSDGAPAFQRWS